MNKRNLWIATGSLGVVALGAAAASAGTYQHETNPGQAIVIDAQNTKRVAGEQQMLSSEETNTRALQAASANTANTAASAPTSATPASAPSAQTADSAAERITQSPAQVNSPAPQSAATDATAPSPVSAQSAQSAQSASSAD